MKRLAKKRFIEYLSKKIHKRNPADHKEQLDRKIECAFNDICREPIIFFPGIKPEAVVRMQSQHRECGYHDNERDIVSRPPRFHETT